jgi:threonine synthase
MNHPDADASADTRKMKFRHAIPAWRMNIYIILMPFLIGMQLQQNCMIRPSIWWALPIVAIGVVYGGWLGFRMGVRQGRWESATIFQTSLREQERRAAEEIGKLREDFQRNNRRIDKMLNEGEEWKRPKRRHPEDE